MVHRRRRAAQIARCHQVLADVKPAPVVEMPMPMWVPLRELGSLV